MKKTVAIKNFWATCIRRDLSLNPGEAAKANPPNIGATTKILKRESEIGATNSVFNM